MFIINLKRIVRSGFVSFWRNGFVSLSSVLIMVTTLFVIGSLVFLSASLQSVLVQLKDKVDINVYLLSTAQPSDVDTLQKTLQALPQVASVGFTSANDALTQFQSKHAGDQLTLQALQELDGNPLDAVLTVKAKDPSDYAAIADFLQGDSPVLAPGGTSIIDKVNYNENSSSIDRLSKIISIANESGLIAVIILVALSVLIAFNTIRLSIYTAREEIGIMRLVGARNSYIRGPFVIGGALYGLASGVITLIIFLPATFVIRNISQQFTGINIFSYYISHIVFVGAGLIICGIAIGAIASYLATRRYLKI
jgi:cell division transport system permease protein